MNDEDRLIVCLDVDHAAHVFHLLLVQVWSVHVQHSKAAPQQVQLIGRAVTRQLYAYVTPESDGSTRDTSSERQVYTFTTLKN